MTDAEGLDFNINITPGQNPNENSNSSQNNQQVTEKSIKSSNKAKKNQISSNEKIDFTNFLSQANHPGIVFFTLFFKSLAIVVFLFFGIFGVVKNGNMKVHKKSNPNLLIPLFFG